MFRVRAKAPTKDATVPTWYEKAREHVKTGLPSFALRSVGRGRKEGPVSERAYPGRKVGTATAAAAYAGLSRSRSPPSVPPCLPPFWFRIKVSGGEKEDVWNSRHGCGTSLSCCANKEKCPLQSPLSCKQYLTILKGGR